MDRRPRSAADAGRPDASGSSSGPSARAASSPALIDQCADEHPAHRRASCRIRTWSSLLQRAARRGLTVEVFARQAARRPEVARQDHCSSTTRRAVVGSLALAALSLDFRREVAIVVREPSAVAEAVALFRTVRTTAAERTTLCLGMRLRPPDTTARPASAAARCGGASAIRRGSEGPRRVRGSRRLGQDHAAQTVQDVAEVGRLRRRHDEVELVRSHQADHQRAGRPCTR